MYLKKNSIALRHKVKIFKMTAIPTLLYGSEVWAPSKDELQRLESWQNKCMRYMLGIIYVKHGNVSGTELRRKTKLRKIEDHLRTRRLRWLGHAARMVADRLPRKMLTGQLGRKRPRGKPRMGWRKVIKEDLEAIRCEDYTKMALDRKSWRNKIMGPYALKSDAIPTRRSQRIRAMRQK